MSEIKPIRLDSRLRLLAEEMTPGGAGIDVGTDHGYLAVYLVQSGLAARMVASDVNSGPLASAESCIAEHGLTDKIEIRLADGLKGLDLAGISDIFIAGMGGILISEILAARHPLPQKLTLQPMTQAPLLRRWLLENGYRIERERCALSGGKVYSAMTARYDGVKRDCSPIFALVGLTPEDGSEAGFLYLERQLARLQRKIAGLLEQRGSDAVLQNSAELDETKSLAAELEAMIIQRKRCQI